MTDFACFYHSRSKPEAPCEDGIHFFLADVLFPLHSTLPSPSSISYINVPLSLDVRVARIFDPNGIRMVE